MIFKKEWARKEHARAAALMGEIGRIHRMWRGMRPPPPLKRSDLALLGMLDHMEREAGQRRMTASKMAVMSHQSLPAVSQKLRALEDGGMISRKADKNDRRVAYVELTDKGRRAAQQSMEDMIGQMEQCMDELGTGEAEQLVALLGRLNDLLDAKMSVEREEVESDC